MEAQSIQRFNSLSSGRTTLVGSDDGLASPLEDPWSVSDRKSSQSPIFQTKDRKSWVRLDTLHPKLLEELCRGYSVPSGDRTQPLTKGTAKIKAWVRQSPVGFVLRFRQKISENHDEVIDAHVKPIVEKTPSPVQQPLDTTDLPKKMFCELSTTATLRAPTTAALRVAATEMPNNAIFEAPAPPAACELPTDSKRQTHIWTIDSLSVHEPNEEHVPPASGGGESPIELPADQTDLGAGLTKPSAWHVSQTTSKVSSSRYNRLKVIPHDRTKAKLGTAGNPSDTMAQLEAHLDETKQQLQQEKQDKEAIASLLKSFQQKLEAHEDGRSKENKNLLTGYEIVDRRRYETETDVEPPSPVERSEATSLRLITSLASPRQKKNTASPKSVKESPTSTSSDEGSDGVEDSRDFAMQRRAGLGELTARAGKEAVLATLLRTLAEILGPGHTLTYKARRKRPRGQKDWHRRRTADLVVLLRKGEGLAKIELGEQHPRVQTFSADLKTFAELVGYPELSSVNESSDRLEEQIPSPGHSPTASSPRGQGDRNDDEAAISPVRATEVIETAVEPSTEPRVTPSIVETLAVPFVRDEIKQDVGYVDHGIPSIPQRPYRQSSPSSTLAGLVVAAVSRSAISVIQWMQHHYGPEPPLEAGKVRVRWTCSCGERLFDDYVERRPGAARELEAFLNRPRTQTSGRASPTSPSNSSTTGNFSGSSIGVPSPISPWSSASSMGQHPHGHERKDGESPSAATTTSPMYTSGFYPRPDPPYLLTCTSEDRYTTKMTHIDVAPDHITSDMKLALALRAHYAHVNRRWWRALRLRGLAAIEFVQFELHANRFADIRASPDVPPPHLRGSDYAFVSSPPDTLPPVGSKLLLHLVRHPEDYDRELMVYLRVPKRTAGRLEFGVGWGVNLVEDFLPDRVLVLVNSVVGFASLVFAIAWACERNDVQGAFGVAQWICMMSIIACGWVQVYVG